MRISLSSVFLGFLLILSSCKKDCNLQDELSHYYDELSGSSYAVSVFILGHDSLISRIRLTLVNTNADCDTIQPNGDIHDFIIDSRNFIREIDKSGYQTIWTEMSNT